LAAKSLEFTDKEDERQIKLFFQDEARFGRIDNICSCWVPSSQRAKVGNQIIRKYTYAYSAICPETGESYFLILPYANTECMDIFMKGVSEEFANYRIIMAMDRASWHTGDKVKKWKNIVPLFQPAYSPELNPVENLWHHIRENGKFKNTTFESMEAVEDRLSEQLRNLDKNTVKSISLFHWINSAI
jgi:transposase